MSLEDNMEQQYKGMLHEFESDPFNRKVIESMREVPELSNLMQIYDNMKLEEERRFPGSEEL